MRVILAEKPDMGRNIADALGVAKSNRGYIELKNGDIVTWAIGHLIKLKTPEQYDQYKEWSLDNLPIIPSPMLFEVDSSRRDQYKVIKDLLGKADTCVIATDPGREGEHIARTIIHACGFKGKLLRLWINDLTPETIKRGFKELKDASVYNNLAAAADVRAKADYWIGFTATRFFTLAVRELTDENALLSAGRVQTPTLKIVYDRELAIENFEPNPFYNVIVTFTTDSGSYKGKWFKTLDGNKISRLDHLEDADKIQKLISGQQGIVSSYHENQVKRSAPHLFDSTSIKTVARRQLGFSIKKTDQVLQSIYDKKYVSYPRTSSKHLSANAADQLADRLESLRSESKYRTLFPDRITSLKGNTRFVDDEKATEHHAIVPTGLNPVGLTADEEALYEIILRRTLAAHYPVGIDKELTAITIVAGETFETKSTSVIEEGWRKVLKIEHKDSETEEDDEPMINSLLVLKQGEQVTTEDCKTTTGKTSPPKRLAEDELVKAMANAGRIIEDDDDLAAVLKDIGIGTPATRSQIVQELLNREYIASKKNLLYLTEKGRNFIRLVLDHPLSSVELTAEFESKLTDIADGKRSAADVISEFKQFVHNIVDDKDKLQQQIQTMLKGSSLFHTVNEVCPCPNCGKPIIERKEFYSCSGYKEGCKVTIPKRFLKVNISSKVAGHLLDGKEVLFQNIPGQYGPYSLFVKYSAGKLETRKPTTDELSLGTCPLCGKHVFERSNFYGCAGYKEGCKFSISKSILDKKLSSSQIRKLLKSGKTDMIKGFKSKEREFNAMIAFDKEQKKIVFIR